MQFPSRMHFLRNELRQSFFIARSAAQLYHSFPPPSSTSPKRHKIFTKCSVTFYHCSTNTSQRSVSIFTSTAAQFRKFICWINSILFTSRSFEKWPRSKPKEDYITNHNKSLARMVWISNIDNPEVKAMRRFFSAEAEHN
jgi:hypothetical protein